MNQTGIAVTEKATSKLNEIAAQERRQSSSVRIGIVRTHCMGGRGFANKMEFDSPATEDDEVFEYNGIKVCVDRTSLHYLAGSEVDYIEEVGREGFTIHNPNVRSKCPCGRHDIFD